MKHAHFHTLKKNADGMANGIAGNASAAVQNLADHAQSAAASASSQLADWAQDQQHQATARKIAALWSLGGSRARRLVLAKPLLCLALAAGAGALAVYVLTRRYGNNSPGNTQTQRQLSRHDTNQQYVSSQATAVQPGID